MADGIRVWNPDGSVQFDMTNRVFRVLTSQQVSANGSYTSAELAKGTPLVSVMSASTTNKKPPVVSVAGNTVSWSYNSIPAAERDTNVRIKVVLY